MSDLITLDHKSCYNPTGRWEASGEWEASPDVLIHIKSYGAAKGPGIVWEHELDGVDLYNGEQHMATAYNHPRLGLIQGTDWSSGEPESLSPLATGWLLGVAYAWAKRDAGDWADKNAEPIAE